MKGGLKLEPRKADRVEKKKKKKGDMSGLERAVEWLRPLVEKKTWDYCVIWKLGDDPSRFIEWMDCCCGGGYDLNNVKVEREEGQHLPPLCRDTYFQHPIRTKACEALSHFPSSLPLYSGIHGEVVVSTQPKWLSHAESNSSHDLVGTQVLIPVIGGLVELFISQHLPKDENIIEFVTARCNIPLEHPFLGKYKNNPPSPLHHFNFIPSLQLLPPALYSSLEGSCSGSNPLNKHPSLDSASCLASMHESKQPIGNRMSKKPESEQYQSKNLVTERNRRNRIKDGLFTLRALVPKITKMDRAAIIGDAIDYIGELQKEVKKLQDELNVEQEDCNMKGDESQIPTLGGRGGSGYSRENNQVWHRILEKTQTERKAQVEVNLIGTREFLLKLSCEHERGGFARLMEAMEFLGLQVVDANITTFNGQVLNIFRVEV